MRKTVTLNLKNEAGEKIKVELRLTITGQMALKKKYKDEGVSLIMSAMDDTEKMLDILEQALNFKGNENTITDSEELYDLLVDNDYQGMDGFANLMIQIGEVSGLFKKKQAEKLASTISETFDKIFDKFEENLTGDLEDEDNVPSETERDKPE